MTEQADGKGHVCVPILQGICQRAGMFCKDAAKTPMIQRQRCDYRAGI
ncbi:MAG: hypothetical protein ACOX7Z_05055 [Dysosmobacter sp.]